MNKGLGELKKKLPYNYRKLLSEATGYSKHYIYLIAVGKRTNWNMLDKLKQLINEKEIIITN